MVSVKRKLIMEPHHRIPGSNLFDIFYRSLSIISRAMENTISRGALMCLHWDMAQKMLDEISVTNQEWYTREVDREDST